MCISQLMNPGQEHEINHSPVVLCVVIHLQIVMVMLSSLCKSSKRKGCSRVDVGVNCGKWALKMNQVLSAASQKGWLGIKVNRKTTNKNDEMFSLKSLLRTYLTLLSRKRCHMFPGTFYIFSLFLGPFDCSAMLILFTLLG